MGRCQQEPNNTSKHENCNRNRNMKDVLRSTVRHRQESKLEYRSENITFNPAQKYRG